jgi:PASTA domain-containing protein
VKVARLTAALTPALAAALLFSGPAAATPVLDQQQTTLDINSELGIGGPDNQILAQVVRSGVAGLLAQIDLPVECGPSASLLLEIRDANTAGTSLTTPGANVLASETASAPPPIDWRSFAFANPPFIPAETSFAFVVSSSTQCTMLAGSLSADPYSRGDGWYQDNSMTHGTWSFGGHDLGFKTYVDRICKVPELVGTVALEAPKVLVQYGCSPGKNTSLYSRSVPEGDVLSQDQPAGTQIAAGAAVNLVVSLGPAPAPCKVPDVRGRKLAKARSALVRANCRVGRVGHSFSHRVKKGRVISQKPAAGSRLRAGTRVNLVVSRGKRH